MSDSQFVTAINCMDGRVQLPVIKWMQSQYDVPYVDMVTEAGPNKLLTEGTPAEIESVRSRVQVSVETHGSEVIAIAGHHGCAGNGVSRDEKVAMIKQSVELIKSWGWSVQVIGLYVNENWEVERVTE